MVSTREFFGFHTRISFLPGCLDFGRIQNCEGPNPLQHIERNWFDERNWLATNLTREQMERENLIPEGVTSAFIEDFVSTDDAMSRTTPQQTVNPTGNSQSPAGLSLRSPANGNVPVPGCSLLWRRRSNVGRMAVTMLRGYQPRVLPTFICMLYCPVSRATWSQDQRGKGSCVKADCSNARAALNGSRSIPHNGLYCIDLITVEIESSGKALFFKELHFLTSPSFIMILVSRFLRSSPRWLLAKQVKWCLFGSEEIFYL